MRNTRSGQNGRRRFPIIARVVVGLVLVGSALIACTLLYPYTLNFTGYPRTTRTASGAAGDPINLILIGSQTQIVQSFQHAGWLVPDPITPQTTAKIIAASLAGQSYPTAPVSPLYVFGRSQDMAFEKPTRNVQNRGHVRLWQTTTHINGRLVWIGQASYDSGIELSATNALPTHHIAPTVDLERNAVGADLETTGLVHAETAVTFASPIIYARNGAGDYYASDGDALVINYTQASLPLHQQTWLLGALKTSVFLTYDAILTLLVTPAALVLVIAGVILLAGLFFISRARARAKARDSAEATVTGR